MDFWPATLTRRYFPFFYVISLQIGLSLHYLEISKAEAARRLEMSRDMEEIKEKNRVLGIIPSMMS